MLRIECQSCRAPYQVDERRVPPSGLKMRCPKCGFSFVVKSDGSTLAAAAPAAPAGGPPPVPKAIPRRAPTMIGVGVEAADLPAVSGAKVDLPAVAPPRADLPAPAKRPPPPVPKPVAPRAAAPPPPANQLDDPFGKISVPGMPAVSLPPALGGLDDLPSVPASQRPAAPGFGSIDLGLDLPAPIADLPAPRPGADLPAPKAADLPARSLKKTALGIGDIELDTRDRAPAAPEQRDPLEADLPAAKAEIGFGEIDLPSLSSDLPAVASAAVGLPAAAASLPAVANQLPAVANQLPVVASGDAFPALASTLPARSQPPADLELSEFDLQPSSSPPRAASPQPFVPGAASGPAPDFGSFGSPLATAAADKPDLLGAAPSAGAQAPTAAKRGEEVAPGGMAFGEVDLEAGAAPGAAPITDLAEPAPRPPAGASLEPPEPSGSAVEAMLPQQQRTRPQKRDKPGKPSRAPRIVLAALGLVIVAGGAMQLTPYGAFGYLAISDAVHTQDYLRAADDASLKARTRLMSDTFADGKGAMDDLAAARQRTPRSKPLSAFVAASIFSFETRFGHDTDRDTRAKQWLAELSKEKVEEVKYLAFARAAQDAAAGNWASARKGLEAASKRDAGDPVQQDIALLRGEVELASKDPMAATTAFKSALAVQQSPRAHFGLARAAWMSGDAETAKREIDEVLRASPKHTGAFLLRAEIRWNTGEDEKGALDDIATALDPTKDGPPVDKTRGLALRGWIHAARGRGGDARNDFDAALKIDPRNVSALVGQGEVFYNEGRFTEALSRFDTAVQTDATDIAAIVSDAKAKIALERLQDAKTQLSEARVAYPKEPRVAYWLGKAEEALGNRSAAEHQYASAIELSSATDREAILPYLALATSLLSRGEAKDSQAKLEEAKSKLPDSAALQRAFGDLAAAQGQYDDAVKYYLNAIERDPANVSTRFKLGSTYRRMGQMDKASEQFDLVVAADKDYPGLALERGLLYEQSGDVEKAIEQFKNALAKAPDDPDLQVRVGAAYVAIEHPDDAIPMLRKVLEKRGTSAEANHYLGRALFLKGPSNEQEAIRYLRRAVELDPHRAEYHLYLGWAANNATTGLLGLAHDELEKALELDKLLADAYWQRGVLERKQAAVDDAIKDLKRALELKPTRHEAHAALGECYEDKQDFNTALAEWQKAIAANDKVPYWRYRYGRLLLDRHQSAEAAKHLTFAADAGRKQDPKPGWYASSEFLAAEALRASGRRAEAKDRYRRFLSIAPMSSPDRRDAIRALRDMGEEWSP